MYGLKYILTQKLRDNTDLTVNILEKDYDSGTTYSYDATEINLQSNASNDEPLAGIISSQLNISFLTSDEDNASHFPDFLSFDDRKYYVELIKNGESILFRGFLFNDYVGLPYTTGNVEVKIVAIDGLSLLNYTKFNYIEAISINDPQKLIEIIVETLNVINYPNEILLFTACSYYAFTMYNRSDGIQYEPFAQTYQYRRDFQDLTYYEVLDNIVNSFGCRLYQSDGEWKLIAINEMALVNRYYTRYNTNPFAYNSAGTWNKDITIEPYVDGNVHFIDNSQNKVVRKGYPKLVLSANYDYAKNYVHNGNLKGYYNSATPPTYIYLPYGWHLFRTGSTGTAELNVNDNLSSNTIRLSKPIPSGSIAYAETGVALSNTLYLPYINNPGFELSFLYKISFGQKCKLIISIYNPATSVTYYYNSSDAWQTSSAYIDILKNDANNFTSYSKKIEISSVNTPSLSNVQGHIRLRFLVDGGTPYPLYEDIEIRSISIVQSYNTIRSLDVIRQVGTEANTIKELNQPYGTYINSYTINNNVGNLVNASGVSFTEWYRYPDTTTRFEFLQTLMARQYSNLLNRNFGTMEANIGKFYTNDGMNYLDKTYYIEDSLSNPLSYKDKAFLMNRGNVNPYHDEVDSFQLIEITNTDNDSTETLDYKIQ